MKAILKLIICLLSVSTFAQQQTANFQIDPASFNEDQEITITVSNVDPELWNTGEPDNIYLWAWYFDLNGDQAGNSPNNGEWDNSNEAQKLINNGDGTYSITLTPTIFFNTTGIGQMGMLVKAKNGNGDKKSQDFITPVGIVNVILTEPSSNTAIVASGGDLDITATMTFQGSTAVGAFEVFINDVSVATGNGFPTYSPTIANITEGGTVRVVGTPQNQSETGEATFQLLIAPTVVNQTMPENLEDGINYNTSDLTKATLVLSAPGKDFVYVATDLNNYTTDSDYLMKADPDTGKFWIELTGLTPGASHTYQYWVYSINPVPNSPAIVKTADPFSTLVLSSNDDPWIPETSYPNIPDYPENQSWEVTVLQTGQSPYDWQVTNFEKPKKEDLIIYEILVRDFDANRNYQDIIDRIQYFKDLNINAIQLMPVMEYEGNESWGYNTSFHMALDKYYGTKDKLKELVDTCHENGIAVILDIALNHAFGRNPMVRMWLNDPDGDGWGNPSSDSPYFNENPMHAYNVGSDFNHQQPLTQAYVERVVKHWIEEFNIDGLRWDLTKGFTQNCSSNDGGCTDSYQQDRVDVLQDYADYSWSLDPTHYVIFEHLGSNTEEQQWANYRLTDPEPKGIMMWGKMTNPYNQLTMGYASDSNINGMGHESRGFTAKRLVGYPESHDEERLMYKNLQFGQTSNAAHNVQELDIALSRMPALGAVSVTIPGPKMIWHFGELGMENSIFTCPDGSVNDESGEDGDCKLDTKPQPQWADNWSNDPIRSEIFETWSKLHALKINEAVFEGNYSIDSGDLQPKIQIWDDNISSTELKNVVIVANFDVVSQTVTPDFPYTGTWFNLMDNTSFQVNSLSQTVTIEAGQFFVFGNQASYPLNIPEQNIETTSVFPNPATTLFKINKTVSNVALYDLTGKLIKAFEGTFNEGFEFDISDLKQGLYLIEIRTENENKISQKLIKL